jgi:hypothetical protein
MTQGVYDISTGKHVDDTPLTPEEAIVALSAVAPIIDALARSIEQ